MKTTYPIENLLLMIVTVSFLGFCLENVWLLLRKGFVDNRNMSLPFLLGYGLAVFGFWLVLGVPEREEYPAYFVCAFLAVSTGEILLGKLVEHCCGFYYWDYSTIPLHITRYTSVPTSMGFAAIITLFMAHGFEPLMLLVADLPEGLHGLGTIPVILVLAVDMASSFYKMYKTHALNVRWQLVLLPKRAARCSETQVSS